MSQTTAVSRNKSPDAAAQTLFDLDTATATGTCVGSALVRQPSRPAEDEATEAKRSIRYMAGAALAYGKMSSLAELLDRIAAFRQYKPYNAFLVLLQRPGATYVLPAHAWSERYGRVIRPDQQPLVMLQPRGPVMFLFDVSQTEEGLHSRPLPVALSNPYGMKETPRADVALRWMVENAKADGVRVLDAPFGLPFAGCVSRAQAGVTQVVEVSRRPPRSADVPVQYDALLNASYSATEKLMTLAHELGHIYCGHLGESRHWQWPDEDFWRDRSWVAHEYRELEAESVARLVLSSLDPVAELPDHLSQYFEREPEVKSPDVV